MRVFPLSNWTELDIWRYIAEENIELPEIYYGHQREVFEHDGMLMSLSPVMQPLRGEPVVVRSVRFRTVGDMTSHSSRTIGSCYTRSSHRRNAEKPHL